MLAQHRLQLLAQEVQSKDNALTETIKVCQCVCIWSTQYQLLLHGIGKERLGESTLPTRPSPQELSDSRLALQHHDQELRHVGRRLQQVEEERQLQMQQLQGTQNALQQAIR